MDDFKIAIPTDSGTNAGMPCSQYVAGPVVKITVTVMCRPCTVATNSSSSAGNAVQEASKLLQQPQQHFRVTSGIALR